MFIYQQPKPQEKKLSKRSLQVKPSDIFPLALTLLRSPQVRKVFTKITFIWATCFAYLVKMKGLLAPNLIILSPTKVITLLKSLIQDWKKAIMNCPCSFKINIGHLKKRKKSGSHLVRKSAFQNAIIIYLYLFNNFVFFFIICFWKFIYFNFVLLDFFHYLKGENVRLLKKQLKNEQANS